MDNDKVDFGSGHYAYMAIVMSEYLKGLVEGSTEQLKNPQGAISAANKMFGVVLSYMEDPILFTKVPEEYGSSQAMANYFLVRDIVIAATKEKEEGRLETKIRQFAELTRELPEKVRESARIYRPLQRFFEILHSTSMRNLSMRTQFGYESPYAALL